MVGVSAILSSEVDRSTCRYCGAHVTDRFRRVFGDDRDRAHRCSECDCYRRLSRGSAAGVDVDAPDPDTADGHHGGGADA